MEIIQVTDYDVLADKMPGQRYVLEDYRRHIGNTRFSVLVDMYREAYDMVHMRGNDAECDKIVERIVGVACHKDVAITVNKGRFLIRQNGEGGWICLDEEESKEVVRQALTAPATILEDDAVEGEVVASTAFSAMQLGGGSPDVPVPLPSNEASGFNSDKKRGRRRSLLRRSASESTMLDDKKKLQIRGLGLDTMVSVAVDGDDNADGGEGPDESTSDYSSTELPEYSPAPLGLLARQSSAPLISRTSEQIKNWDGMDVVLSASGRTLTTKETVIGNNRLQVMISLQKDGYKTMSTEEKDRTAEDLVKAVCQYWNGRILQDQGFAYAKLEGEQAVLAMKNLLDPDEAQSIMVSTAPPSKPLLSAPQVPEFLRNASLEILSGNVADTGDPHSMQSQAVKSLQERKAKRTMTKNLGRLHATDDIF